MINTYYHEKKGFVLLSFLVFINIIPDLWLLRITDKCYSPRYLKDVEKVYMILSIVDDHVKTRQAIPRVYTTFQLEHIQKAVFITENTICFDMINAKENTYNNNVIFL